MREVEARNRKDNNDNDNEEKEEFNEEEKTHRKELQENITQEEVSKAIDQLQNYRASRQDGVIGDTQDRRR